MRVEYEDDKVVVVCDRVRKLVFDSEFEAFEYIEDMKRAHEDALARYRNDDD